MFSEDKQCALHTFSKAFSDALKIRDAYTRLHSERVMHLSKQLAIEISLSECEIQMLQLASALHDIGKIAIPDHVLLKPTSLAPNELEVMQTHPEVGAKVIGAFEHEDAQHVAIAIKHHHEWFDGSGYPDRLSGEEIPILSRVIAVADNYDAMAVRRVYNSDRKHSEIMHIMASESGSKLDPHLFNLFTRIIEKDENRVYQARQL